MMAARPLASWKCFFIAFDIHAKLREREEEDMKNGAWAFYTEKVYHWTLEWYRIGQVSP